jgi:hypothetical protein
MPSSLKGEFKLDFLIYVTGCIASINLALQVYTELVSEQSVILLYKFLAEALSTQTKEGSAISAALRAILFNKFLNNFPFYKNW